MKPFLVLTVAAFLTAGTRVNPIREGFAESYSFHDNSAPGTVFIATNHPGLSLSDTYSPALLNHWLDQLNHPKPFYIRVFHDHMTATDPATGHTDTIAIRDVVAIDWRK